MSKSNSHFTVASVETTQLQLQVSFQKPVTGYTFKELTLNESGKFPDSKCHEL